MQSVDFDLTLVSKTVQQDPRKEGHTASLTKVEVQPPFDKLKLIRFTLAGQSLCLLKYVFES